MYILRSRYNYDMAALSVATGLECKDESMAVQSQKDDADINVLVRRFGLTGVMPPNHRVPEYGDFSGVVDYQSALNAVMAAQESFMEMPAAVRAEFDNDPQQFLQFTMDAENIPRMRELGLAIPAVVEHPTKVEIVASSVPPLAPVPPVPNPVR